jgi:hypothetical protein
MINRESKKSTPVRQSAEKAGGTKLAARQPKRAVGKWSAEERLELAEEKEREDWEGGSQPQGTRPRK